MYQSHSWLGNCPMPVHDVPASLLTVAFPAANRASVDTESTLHNYANPFRTIQGDPKK